MKVRDYIKFLMDFNMDAEVVVSTGDTFDDYAEMDISWEGLIQVMVILKLMLNIFI